MADRVDQVEQAAYGDGAEAERPGVPGWVPAGQEERWHNSVTVARQLMGENEAAVWQMSRTIFNDPEQYPD